MKILIVDDEKMIRNWLTILLHQIPDRDIEIATASNVDEALEYCARQDINLVLTDITMPQRNGLELLQILRETYPKISTAVLSAYDDYQYIRSAMQLGAIDYILKSEMQLSDILSVLRKVELFSGGAVSEQAAPGGSQNTEYSLTDFIDDADSLRDFLSRTAPALTMDEVMVSTFTLESGQDIRPPQVLDICNRTLTSEGVTGCSYYAKNAFWVIYNTGHAILEHQKMVQQKVSLLLDRNLRMVVHQRIQDETVDAAFDVDGLRNVLNQQLIRLHCRQYYSVSPMDRPQFSSLPRESLDTAIKEIRFLLETHCYSDAANVLIRFVQDAHRNRVFPSELKFAIHHCITIIFLNSPILRDNIIFTSRYQDITHQLNLADTAESVSGLVNEVCMLYKEELRDAKKNRIPPALKKAIDYIGENYMYRLTLDDLARQVYLNKNYISQMFMKHLGISFGSYLESVRIYKAQELLRNTDISVTKIAEESGYTSQSYFTKAFTKRVGISPLKYRAMSLSDSLL